LRTDFGNTILIYHIENLELLWNVMILLSIVMIIISVSIYFKRFLEIIAQKS